MNTDDLSGQQFVNIYKPSFTPQKNQLQTNQNQNMRGGQQEDRRRSEQQNNKAEDDTSNVKVPKRGKRKRKRGLEGRGGGGVMIGSEFAGPIQGNVR